MRFPHSLHFNWVFLLCLTSIILMTTSALSPPIRALPDKVLIGYGHNCDNVRKAVHDGVNIVIWAFLNIVATSENDSSTHRELLETTTTTTTSVKRSAEVRTDLDLKAIQELIQELDQSGYSHVLHLVSFGGWNGPHLDPNLTAKEWYAGWTSSIASKVFHGIDWDLEGHDDLTWPTNVFTIECLEKMGHISQLMKKDGYMVGMAPPQSYMNFDDTHFSRYVNLTVPDRPWHADFHYYGANVYSYLLAKYEDSIDFVSMQLYESYSLAAMAVYHFQMSPEDYLVSYIHDLTITRQSKFYVDFAQDPTLNMDGQYVQLPLSKLVIGLANGWAADPENERSFFISPEECQRAYDRLKSTGHGDLTPRGFMFWTIEERGTRGVYLARDIHKFLNA